MSGAPGAIDRLAAATRALAGRRRALIAIALGIAATLALPPVHAVPLLLPAFAGLAWMIEGAGSTRRAFWAGWWFGLGHFATGFYWVSHAMLVDAAKFGWMIPFALVALGGGMAIYAGIAAALAFRLARLRIALAFALAASWLVGEWLRGHVLSGFAWNLIATAWAWDGSMLQPVAWIGGYGWSALTVLIAASPAALADAGGWRRLAPIAASAACLAIAFILGPRLDHERAAARAGDRPLLRLVQPDIAQSLKWDPNEREKNLRVTLELTAAAGLEKVQHVVWPESATIFPIADNAELRAALARIVPANGYLLTGAVRVERQPRFQAWNSLHALDAGGDIVATFDKFHLVPFGEYVPLRGILPIDKIAPGPVDFSAGPGPRTLRLPGLPAYSPLICYEIIFPAAVVDRRDRPDWILNVTNDAWFGISAGPFQHFAAARLRAVEEGLPVVRVANNGISAVIDGRGEVRARLELGRRGIVDAELPAPQAATFYARWGDLVLPPLIGALLLLGRALGDLRGEARKA